jgi:hypothetical protein
MMSPQIFRRDVRVRQLVVREQQATFPIFFRNLCLVLATAACDCTPDRAGALLGSCCAKTGSSKTQVPSTEV